MIKKDEQLKQSFLELLKTDKLRGKTVRKTIRKNLQIILQGGNPRAVHLIYHGVVKCFITEPNGREYILELLGEGEFLGDLEMLTEQPYQCTVQAMTDVTVYKLNSGLYFEMIENGGELTKLMMKQLASRLRRTSGRASYQLIYPIEYAILKLLSSLQENEVVITKKDLSDYLAIPVRSLNRNLNRLAEIGIIDLSGKKITILSEEKLLGKLEEYHV